MALGTSFDLEVSYGDDWKSLNDHVNFVIGANSFGNQAVARRRMTVTSPFYEGEYEVHSVRENVKEEVEIYVTGDTQVILRDKIALLEDIFDQLVYNMRVTRDLAQEVWVCQPADYSIDRTHIQMHNCRAVFTASIPRLPKVYTYTVTP